MLAAFWASLRSSSHSGVWWGRKRFEGMFESAVDFIREIKWESVLSIRWSWKSNLTKAEKVGGIG